MCKPSPWYLLFVLVLAVGSVIWLRDFSMVIMMVSFTVSDPLYLWLEKTQQRKQLIPCGILLALILGGFYYFADLMVFPHSTRAADRLQDSCLIGLLWSAGGLAAAYWSPANKRAFPSN